MTFIKERFILKDSKLHELKPVFGYNDFGEIVYYRSYSRTINGKQEHWPDTVKRVIEGIMSIRKDHYIRNHISWIENYWQQYAEHMAYSMFRMEWLPPGRGLWAMGTDLIRERGSMALYNCCATEIGKNWINDLDWLMDCLMCGCGVGFRPTRNNLSLIEPCGTFDYTIPDSREGWIKSVILLLKAYDRGTEEPIFDYSEIRPEGALIKTFGGIASGPKPLINLHNKIRELCNRYIILNDPEYEFDDCYDEIQFKTDLANLIGVCVVTGNVRRSAELALCDFNEDIFWDLKNYNKYPERQAWGFMSNNSVILSENEHFENIDRIAQANVDGYDIGYVNHRNLKYGRIGKNDNLRDDKATLLNPCIRGTSLILTHKGLKKIQNLLVGEYIWSETGWTKVTNKVMTGIKPIYKYSTNAGYIECTENHELVSDGFKIEAKYCDVIDSLTGPQYEEFEHIPQLVVDGLVLGDGSRKNKHVLLDIDQDYFTSEITDLIVKQYNKEKQYIVTTNIITDELPERTIPKRFLFLEPVKIASLLKGIYSANGSICGNRVTLKTTSYQFMRQVQILLSSLGIRSYYTTNLIEWDNGEFVSKESYDLSISHDRIKFRNIIGFIQEYKNKILNEQLNKSIKEKKTFEILNTEYLGEFEVYDITVDNLTHTFWCQGLNISNCGEITLENKEVCNVVDTLPTRCVDKERWLQACEYATFYASTVSLLPTHRLETNTIVNRNRRIGVGIIDVSGWIYQEGVCKITSYLREGYDKIREVNKYLAEEAGIPASIKVTTIKPGGSTTKVAGRTPGIGHPTFHYTLRRIRVQKNTILETILKSANIPFEDDKYTSNTTVFEYPILQGPAKTATDVSLWEQASNLVLMQREWADNAVSNTLYFRPRWNQVSKYCCLIGDKLRFKLNDGSDFSIPEVDYTKLIRIGSDEYKYIRGYPIETSKLLKYNSDHEENDIEAVLSSIAPLTKSVSLLPHSDIGIFEQMPEEGISKKEYEQRLSAIKSINWSEYIGVADIEEDKYCSGDKCSVK